MRPVLTTSTSFGFASGDLDVSALPGSAATMGYPEIVSATRMTGRGPTALVRQRVGSFVIATMLPFGALDELLFRQTQHSTTVLGQLIVADEDQDMFLPEPTIIVIEPHRTTFRFRSGRRARRLPPRLPFVSPSTANDDE